jgi:ABC-2 type transport system ATP-binding protein
MTDPSTALSIAGLWTRYGKRNVLRDLSLEVGYGEIYGLLGPNGAGKTTLIRTICGRVAPVGGTIEIAGIRNNNRRALRQIGLVPQEIALYPHLTVRENLDVFGRLSGLSRGDTGRAIEWVSDAAQLESRMHDRVEILSGGWKRRANIAAAILHQPALLILDEPTVGVDVDARNGLHELILELSRTGMGVLLTTHDMEQAETLCSTVGFLRDGCVDPQGHPRQLIEEMYQDYKEIIVELRYALIADQSDILHHSGFAPSNGGLSWSRFSQPGKISTSELSVQLERSGIEVREIRVREPGLDSLFVHLSRGTDQSEMESAA